MCKYKKIVIDIVSNGFIITVDNDVPSVFNTFPEVLRFILSWNVHQGETRTLLQEEIERLKKGYA